MGDSGVFINVNKPGETSLVLSKEEMEDVVMLQVDEEKQEQKMDDIQKQIANEKGEFKIEDSDEEEQQILATVN